MEENELIIDKDTNLLKIWNRDIYTKLTISYMTKYKQKVLNMRNFNNVKELIITSNDGIAGYKYAECTINHFDFIHQLEKITYKNIKNYGEEYYSSKNFILDAPNLKSIEFPSCVTTIYDNYLKETCKLEEIIFNVSSDTLFDSKDLNVSNTNLKNIIIKTKYDTFNINLEYKPDYISDVKCYDGKIYVKFTNKNITSEAEIKNGKLTVKNILNKIDDDLIKDDCLYIPDYITDIDVYNSETLRKISKMSLNLNLLSSNIQNIYGEKLTRTIPLNDINSIIVRNDNKMALFQQKEYNINNYGKLNNLYIRNHKLHILFENVSIKIDKNGNERKTLTMKNIDTIEELKPVYKDFSNKTSINELIELISFIKQEANLYLQDRLLTLIKNCIQKDIEFEYDKCLKFIKYCCDNQKIIYDYNIPSLGKMFVMSTYMEIKDPSIIYKLMDLIISNSKTNSCSNANILFYYMMVSRDCYKDDERWYNRVVEVINNNVDTKIALKDDYSITGICPNLYESEIRK